MCVCGDRVICSLLLSPVGMGGHSFVRYVRIGTEEEQML